jgi:hypothetical protein
MPMIILVVVHWAIPSVRWNPAVGGKPTMHSLTTSGGSGARRVSTSGKAAIRKRHRVTTASGCQRDEQAQAPKG